MRWEIKWDRFLFLFQSIPMDAVWSYLIGYEIICLINNFFLKFHFEERNTWSFFIFIIFHFRGEKIPSFTCKLKLTKVYAQIVSMIPSPKNCQKYLLLFSVGKQAELNKSCNLIGSRSCILSLELPTGEWGRIIALTFSMASANFEMDSITINFLEIIVQCMEICPWWKPYMIFFFWRAVTRKNVIDQCWVIPKTWPAKFPQYWSPAWYLIDI